MIYQSIIRPVLFLFDPEKIHHFSFSALKFLLRIPGIGMITKSLYQPKGNHLEKELWGLTFKNPIGLAAGFDKNALLGTRWADMGFGFVEVGTITPRPQVGNPKKRLFRLPKDQAVINRMGFNNDGLETIAKRLEKMPSKDIIIGANIGKNKDTPNEEAVDDYMKCFVRLFDLVDYFVVNVSSPNTPGLRALQEKAPLTALLRSLQERNQSMPQAKPILLKIAPDMNEGQLKDVAEVLVDTQMDGLILTNTTISREGLNTSAEVLEKIGNGGLSGAPLSEVSQHKLIQIRQFLPDGFPIVGVGGIINGKTAKSRLAAGASLIQLYTGYVYHGPAMLKEIGKGLQ